MTTKQIPDSIQASIHQDAINRVSQFFNATTSDILNELLQNARRSGATRVDITARDGLITITDDGQGISDPSTILAFGQSEWDEHTALNEHPAGMGLYALARCELVTVHSKSENRNAWQVTLTPEHFVGKLAAPVEHLLPELAAPSSTTVTFTTEQPDQNTQDEVEKAAKYYPLPVYLNGASLTQRDFLQEADHIQKWQGVRIGVYKGSDRPMNFHGIVIRHPLLPKVDTIGRDTWTTRVDVIDCPQLELTLPARREVVETPFMEKLRRACQGAIYQAMSLQHVDVPKQVQEDAAAMGISIPDAAPRLASWQPQIANSIYYEPTTEYRQVTDDTIVLDLDLSAANQQALARAAEQNGAMDRFYKQNTDLIGYQWYDRLTKATRVQITVTDQDGDREIKETQTELNNPGNQRPDRIVFTLLDRPNHPKHRAVEIISLPADAAFDNAKEHSLYNAAPLVTKDSAINVQQLSGLLMDGFFNPSDKYDSDSYDTQGIRSREGLRQYRDQIPLIPA